MAAKKKTVIEDQAPDTIEVVDAPISSDSEVEEIPLTPSTPLTPSPIPSAPSQDDAYIGRFPPPSPSDRRILEAAGLTEEDWS